VHWHLPRHRRRRVVTVVVVLDLEELEEKKVS
jgi:hypothetical protein